MVTGENGSICGLLGASPGASTCVSIGQSLAVSQVFSLRFVSPALDVIEKCFGKSPEFKKWSPKLKELEVRRA